MKREVSRGDGVDFILHSLSGKVTHPLAVHG